MTDDGLTKLGAASSRKEDHDHPAGHRPSRGARCSACRWTEVEIFWTERAHGYLIRITGRSILPGEHDRRKDEFTISAHWVVEYLHKRDDEGALYIPLVAKKALAEAAAQNEALEDAFINRAVA